MPLLEIDGIGKVEVGKDFMSLSPTEQSAEVDNIAATIAFNTREPEPAQNFAPGSEEAEFLRQANAARPAPDTLKGRGTVLPVGVSKEGEVTSALPEFIEGPRKTIMDLIEGRRTAQQITGKEIFELGALFAGGSAAAGTGGGIARSATVREAESVLPKRVEPPMAAPEPVPGARVEVRPTPTAERAPVAEAAPATAEELKVASKSLYQQADDAGVVIAPESMTPLARDIFQTAAKEGLDPTLTPDSLAALKRIAEVAKEPISFTTLDILRQIASDAKGATRPNDRRVASLIVDKLDDFVRNLSEKDVLSGDSKLVAEVIPKARDLWSRAAKLETVAGLVDRAATSASGFTGSGFENALRAEFRALSKNKRQMRTFTAEEQAAIKKVARGGAVENTARNVGRFAPQGPVSFFTTGGAGAAIGTALGIGPVAGAAAAGGVAFGARKLATILTQRNVRALEKVIREGGSELASASIQRGSKLIENLSGRPLLLAGPETAEKSRRK